MTQLDLFLPNKNIRNNDEGINSHPPFPPQDSHFLRVHQVLPVSTFKVRDHGDLVLSLPFLQHLTALPLEYSYAMYRDLLLRFGTHYIASGKLGGQYDLLYQYSREELNTSGTRRQAQGV